jgi:hypothetical protein
LYPKANADSWVGKNRNPGIHLGEHAVEGSNLGEDLFVFRALKLERQLIHSPSIWARVNFFGSMNWIGIGAVYPGIEPKVKRSITQTVPIVPVVSVVSNGRKHCDDFGFGTR